MSRYYREEAYLSGSDQDDDGGFQRSAKNHVDHPKRSPIRRKDKFRQAEGMKPKAKRNYKKIQNKIKATRTPKFTPGMASKEAVKQRYRIYFLTISGKLSQ